MSPAEEQLRELLATLDVAGISPEQYAGILRLLSRSPDAPLERVVAQVLGEVPVSDRQVLAADLVQRGAVAVGRWLEIVPAEVAEAHEDAVLRRLVAGVEEVCAAEDLRWPAAQEALAGIVTEALEPVVDHLPTLVEVEAPVATAGHRGGFVQ